MNEQSMRLMIPINPNVPKDETHMPDNLVLCMREGEYDWHPGTDGRETQWETEYLPNYRLVGFMYSSSILLSFPNLL